MIASPPIPALAVAAGDELAWCRESVRSWHYLRTAPDPRTRPIAYIVRLAGAAVGCLFFGRPEATRCYDGSLTYGSLADVCAGRARYDRWEVLCLSRVWFSPHVQRGAAICEMGAVPGFRDRKGRWRSTLASTVLRMALERVGFDYLTAHLPCFLDEPYAIRVIMSYCDVVLHRGTIYRHSGFQLARTNAAGIQTWWTDAVAPLAWHENMAIRHASHFCARSERIREQRVRKERGLCSPS